jgi:isopentenyl diphosphate isomerase/L-lactate dehydrogenase-like FMN-dependent dehydrogenase
LLSMNINRKRYFQMLNTSRVLSPSRVVNIADLRTMAKRRVPKVVFDYLDGGAEGEITLRENCKAFETVTFRPNHGLPVSKCDLRTRVLGWDLSFPAILAPVGYSRLMHPTGEIAAARAAGEAGTGYILSTLSGHPLEKVRAASSGPVCYQLYLLGGREAAEGTIQRAQTAGCSALVITIDTSVSGLRERDFRNGMKELMGQDPFAKIPFLPDLLAHPGWLIGFFRDGGVPRLANVVIPGQGPMPMTDVNTALSQSAFVWEDMKWIRKAWQGPIVIKGVLTADDARRSVDEGAAAIVVSNHGGRQLDGVSATLPALPEIVRAVKDQTEVLIDGGVRRGSDIAKAICLGARAVLIGRAYAYGLTAAGGPGVTRAIEILKADLDRTLKLLGCTSIAALNRSYVQVPWETE